MCTPWRYLSSQLYCSLFSVYFQAFHVSKHDFHCNQGKIQPYWTKWDLISSKDTIFPELRTTTAFWQAPLVKECYTQNFVSKSLFPFLPTFCVFSGRVFLGMNFLDSGMEYLHVWLKHKTMLQRANQTMQRRNKEQAESQRWNKRRSSVKQGMPACSWKRARPILEAWKENEKIGWKTEGMGEKIKSAGNSLSLPSGFLQPQQSCWCLKTADGEHGYVLGWASTLSFRRYSLGIHPVSATLRVA